MVDVDPLLVVIQVLVHVDEPAVVQVDILVVDHIHEVGILTDGANGADEDGLLAFFILGLDEVSHFPGDGLENGRLVLHDHHGDLRIGEQLLFVVVVIIVMHSTLPSF